MARHSKGNGNSGVDGNRKVHERLKRYLELQGCEALTMEDAEHIGLPVGTRGDEASLNVIIAMETRPTRALGSRLQQEIEKLETAQV